MKYNIDRILTKNDENGENAKKCENGNKNCL
jgi:hypothetical protein